MDRHFSCVSDVYNLNARDIKLLGFDPAVYLNNFDHVSKLYGRFVPSEILESLFRAHCYSETMTVFYDHSGIEDWNMLTDFIRLFLLRVISSTPFYACPYSMETTYILPELLDILDTGILPIDSQPGLYIDDCDPCLQLPYLEILAPVPVLDKILTGFGKFISSPPHLIESSNHYKLIDSGAPNFLGNRYISIVVRNNEVIKDYDDFMRKKFPIFDTRCKIGSIMFGTKAPNDNNLMDDFPRYIFTNSFFIGVKTIIQMGLSL